MVNQAVELHDSRVTRTMWSGPDLVVSLSVYVHRSEGRPDRDGGTGWTQDAELRVGTAKLLQTPREPLWILDGSIKVGDLVFENLLPIPFDHRGCPSW